MEPRKRKSGKSGGRTQARAYHHGDLAAALVEAAEAVLTERGVEGFTLRECARRAGVSHAAPAHHFKDTRSLLTEVAAVGFERLTQAERDARDAEPNPANRLVGVGMGYAGFALAHPAQFQLMFQRGLLDQTNERYLRASSAAFSIYTETYAAVYGVSFPENVEKLSDVSVLREWANVHGVATLAIQGQLGPAKTAADIASMKRLIRAVFDDAQKYGLPLKI